MKKFSQNTVNSIFNNENIQSITEFILYINGGMAEKKDTLWTLRAESFIGYLLEPLIYLRDHNNLKLNIDIIMNYISLDNAIELSENQAIPKKHRDGLLNYFTTLPCFLDPMTSKRNTKIKDITREYHAYVAIQFHNRLTYLTI